MAILRTEEITGFGYGSTPSTALPFAFIADKSYVAVLSTDGGSAVVNQCNTNTSGAWTYIADAGARSGNRTTMFWLPLSLGADTSMDLVLSGNASTNGRIWELDESTLDFNAIATSNTTTTQQYHDLLGDGATTTGEASIIGGYRATGFGDVTPNPEYIGSQGVESPRPYYHHQDFSVSRSGDRIPFTIGTAREQSAVMGVFLPKAAVSTFQPAWAAGRTTVVIQRAGNV